MSYSQWYTRITEPFRKRSSARFIELADKLLVVLFVVSYGILLVALVATQNSRLVAAVAVPAVTFALSATLRALVNRPRPYDAGDIEPLIAKDTRGKSLPSLHVASATIIAFTTFQFWPLWGCILFVACACIVFTRIVGGVHYPTDIAAAIAIALACGIVGFHFL